MRCLLLLFISVIAGSGKLRAGHVVPLSVSNPNLFAVPGTPLTWRGILTNDTDSLMVPTLLFFSPDAPDYYTTAADNFLYPILRPRGSSGDDPIAFVTFTFFPGTRPGYTVSGSLFLNYYLAPAHIPESVLGSYEQSPEILAADAPVTATAIEGQVPGPATLGLLGGGLALVAGLARRRRNR